MSEAGLDSDHEIKSETTGLFQPHRNTRISAVATLEDRISKDALWYSFKIFHNPYAIIPISEEVFKGYKQFTKNDVTGVMEWIL